MHGALQQRRMFTITLTNKKCLDRALFGYKAHKEVKRARKKSRVTHEQQASDSCFVKEIKNASKCIVELYKHAGSLLHEDEDFYFFYKMLRKLRALKVMMEAACVVVNSNWPIAACAISRTFYKLSLNTLFKPITALVRLALYN